MAQLEFNPTTSSEIWQQIIQQLPQANFLQSLEWANFHMALKKDAWAFTISLGSELVGVMVVVKETAKRGDYLTVAGGPVFLPNIEADAKKLEDSWQQVTLFLKKFAEQQSVWFVRVRPQLLDTPQHRQLLSSLGYAVSPMHLTADLTLQLDLSLSEEELLADMRKNTRYEIRKAEKLGITVKQSTDAADIDEFYEHQLYLAEKHGFVPFSKQFLREQFLSFLPNQVSLFHAYLEDKLLASAFIIFYNHEAVYHYGISTPENTKLPGSYAGQWAAILEAKNRGCTRYNFWGIAPEADKDHRFAGVSLFKRGFGGQEVAYLPAHDLPVSKLYGLTKGFEKIRKLRRGL